MRVRPLALLSIAAASLIVLAGCSSSSTSTSTTSSAVDLCDATAASGAASEAVSVTGDVGQAPTVTFTSPLDVGDTQETTVVVAGTGAALADGDYLTYAYTAYDADTGEQLDAGGYDPALDPQAITGSSVILGPALGCATVGTRVVTTYPATSSSSAVVFVIDVLAAVAGDEWCQPVSPATGAAFPTVTWNDDGSPSVTVPTTETAPTSVTEQVLTQGDGDTVASGDSVTVNYQLATWADGTVVETSWGSTAATFATTDVVAGFGNALIGQQVGTSVLVVVPPDCGYSSTSTSDMAGQTLVFVISIESVTAS